MASQEYELADIVFNDYLLEGMQGYCDNNFDGMASIEELFNYTRYNLENNNGDYHPKLLDNYPGELKICQKRLPPNRPYIYGPEIAYTNKTAVYGARSTDPENDNIRYYWNWYNQESNDYFELWTDFYESGKYCQINHIFETSGIYKVFVKASDKYGSELLFSPFSELRTIVCSEDEIIDQYQLIGDYSGPIGNDAIFAQSFKPKARTISKVKLKFSLSLNGDSHPVFVSIRDNLTGEDLTSVAKIIHTEDEGYNDRFWIEFLFDSSISLIPDQTYYIVLKSSYTGEGYQGWEHSSGDLYKRGDKWVNLHGDEWTISLFSDFTFITYE